MSRYKNLGGMHFDKKMNSKKATPKQLELLAAAENVPIDDILDEGLCQGEVMKRLALVLHGDIIPVEILERKRLAREEAARQPICRICSQLGWECEGSITRHHFIPRWMMLWLDNYPAYAARSKCTIPICIGRHRDLHMRNDQYTPKSIAQFMTNDERKFAQKMLEELEESFPGRVKLIRKGDSSTYEHQLISDYDNDSFAVAELEPSQAEKLNRITQMSQAFEGAYS